METTVQLAILALSVLAVLALVVYLYRQNTKTAYSVPKEFPPEWRTLLETHVHFYQNLNPQERKKYERKVRRFMRKVRVTGIKTKVEDLDRLLVASSAVIPLFGFGEWEYNNLHEVLIYPKHFDKNFSMDDPKETILGMVGSGNGMDDVMILSKESLRQGFMNPDDMRNTGIHEFVHIIDKADGSVDGIPGVLNKSEYATPWLQLMHKEISKIKKGKSDINEYGATNEQEFLAVTSEYFFERPQQLKDKHPEIYRLLKKAYGQSMAKRLRNPFRKKRKLGRNDDCPCKSGEKFKNCCMEN